MGWSGIRRSMTASLRPFASWTTTPRGRRSRIRSSVASRRHFLRTHADQAARYAALKRHVVARSPQDRLAYIEGKDGYVTALEARAVAWAPVAI
jgi:GrpB-like predicted nucleotidyltransferase (UPF0157 family)